MRQDIEIVRLLIVTCKYRLLALHDRLGGVRAQRRPPLGARQRHDPALPATAWRLGALFGNTEEEAFFITCDRTTMSQDDIFNGRLICVIGIAPVRPAEFVIFRIFQHTAESRR